MPGKTDKLELIARRLKEISEKLDRILKFQKTDRESPASMSKFHFKYGNCSIFKERLPIDGQR